MKQRHQRQTHSQSNTLRIIGGEWRGRKLPFANAEGLRPTGDRIRETLFNWLQQDIPAAKCLDLFSGSGALALEALSRGAAHADLLEKNQQAATLLRQNLNTLNATHGHLHHTDTLTFLKQPSHEKYDVIFLDPPFSLNLWDTVITYLDQGEWLNKGAAIYIESPKNHPLATPDNWHLHRQKHSGQVSFSLFYL